MGFGEGGSECREGVCVDGSVEWEGGQCVVGGAVVRLREVTWLGGRD